LSAKTRASRAFVVLGFVFSIPCQEIGSGKRLRNDLYCVEWDARPQLGQSVASVCVRAAVCWDDCGPAGRCMRPNQCLCDDGRVASSCPTTATSQLPPPRPRAGNLYTTHSASSVFQTSKFRKSLRQPNNTTLYNTFVCFGEQKNVIIWFY